ncbi:lipase secretion chaperone [Massilia sp. 2TAF26]|uniref:lipase secretion chaperone n=1 Tax=Massilia sp. 2TAF26 TaxID=3233012 RepID=UPI003F980567
MAFLLDSKLGFGTVCVAGIFIGVTAAFWLQGGDAPPARPAPAAASAWDGAIGPGALAAPAPSPGSASREAAPGEPSLVDAGGRLIIGLPLRQLIDSYVVKTKGGARQAGAAELRAYLRQGLKQPALAQAEGLVGDYLRYLDAEQGLRAQLRIAPPGEGALDAAQVGQMEDWLRQRTQLRERMLGTAVAQAWFAAEDADCDTALADWRRMHAPAGSAEVDSNELQARRLHGAVLEQRREEGARLCAAQLIAGMGGGAGT